MKWTALVRLGIALALVVTVFAAGGLGAFDSLDRSTLDARYELSSRPASGRVVFVDIDSASLKQVGVWPWPRDIHAQILNRLMELGAADVGFDIDFSSRSTDTGDAAFAEALADAGGYAALAAFEQTDGATGAHQVNLPIPMFAAEAQAVSVNVAAGPDGLVDRIPGSIATAPPIPALPHAFGATGSLDDIHLDFAIDLATVDRIPVGDLLAGRVDAARIADRQAVVGASAIELRDIFSVPRYGSIPGPLLQIAGMETLRANRSHAPVPDFVLLALSLLLGAATAMRRRASLRASAAVAVAVLVLVEGVALALEWTLGMTMRTASFDVAILVLAALQLATAFVSEYTTRRRAEAQLVYLARHDPITGSWSRLGLTERMTAQTASSVMLVGVRRLDLVRGTLGQEVAEAALKQIAERLADLQLGEIGVIDRDVFAISLVGVATEDTARIVRRVLATVLTVDGHAVHVDLATATATASGLEPETLLRRAELALGDAATGDAATFVPELETAIERRRSIDVALRQAIVGRELSVVFQPQVRLSDGELVGVEALVRWNSASLGWVSPAEFIPLAEETGLIVQLGAFVLTEACRAAREWDWDGRVAVNVSAEQFRLDDIGEMVADALTETGFPPSRLDLELTESILVETPQKLGEAMAGLRKLGVGIAIDDFGTGYSSLSYLSELDFDKLKIDQSFVRTLEAGTARAKVVQTIVDLGRRLDKTIVAEGVETDEQRALLAQMGCDIGQGYLISKPVPAAEIAARIARTRAAVA